ncbi:MAG: hypothetical protein ACKPKQ_22955 [Dolichospermum sp.]
MATKGSSSSSSSSNSPMTIRLVKKDDKFKSMVIDAFRILAWEQFKAEYKVRKLEGYQAFYEIWITHEIHSMTYPQLQELYTSLDYSLGDLAKIRNDYYSKRRSINQEGSEGIVRESDDFSDEVKDLAF